MTPPSTGSRVKKRDRASTNTQHPTPNTHCLLPNAQIKCSHLASSIFAQESEQDSHWQEPSPGDFGSSDLPILTAIAAISFQSGSQESTTTETCEVLQTELGASLDTTSADRGESALSQRRHPVSPSPSRVFDSEEKTQEIASRQSSRRSQSSSQNSSRLKTSPVCSPARLNQESQLVHISEICSGALTASGTMRNGFVSPAATLERPGLEKGCCWLPRPGALSNSSGSCRPPGMSKFEGKCRQLGLLQKMQVASPEFLEEAFGLPIGWTNPSEPRAATELLGSGGRRSVTALTPDWQRSPSSESSTSTALPEICKPDNYSDMKSHTSTPLAPMSSQEPAAAEAKLEVAPVEVLEEITYDEERERHRLELRVERAFYEAGKALAELRDRRLYRSTHRTFEAYCRDRFRFTHRHVNYLVAGSQVVENLQTGTMVPKFYRPVSVKSDHC